MSQMDQFMDAFKATLKQKGITYRDLAPVLELSESSVKRLLSTKSLGLDRLDQLCSHFDLSLSDIMKRAQFSLDQAEPKLTLQQEEALARDLRLLGFYTFLLKGLKPQQIVARYEVSEAESERFLLKLDKLGLIELHPKGRIKLRAHKQLVFNRQGALGRVLFEQTKAKFLLGDFDGEFSYLRFGVHSLTPQMLAKLRQKLQRLERELEEEAQFVPEHDPAAQDVGLMFAFRPWVFEQFYALKERVKKKAR